MPKISIALAVLNEEQNLETCLMSVKGCADEIIIVDGGSTDQTIQIAKSFGAKVIKANNPPIFHINKQKALDACQNEWILQLDADEVVGDLLKEEIKQVVSDPKAKDGYYLPRKNYFIRHWMRKGAQYPDYVIRLFRNGRGKFPCRSVHEQIAIDGEVGYLKNPLDHYTYRSIAEYWKKAGAYINLTVLQMRKDHLVKNWYSWWLYAVVKPNQTFWSLFIRHKGFMDGIYGFLFALFSALHHPLAYYKYLYSK